MPSALPPLTLPAAAPRVADKEVAGRLDGVRKDPAAEVEVTFEVECAFAGGGVTGIVTVGRDAAVLDVWVR